MEKSPTVYSLQSLLNVANGDTLMQTGKYWVPARPLGLSTIGNRIRATWLTFTGKADIVVWPGGQ